HLAVARDGSGPPCPSRTVAGPGHVPDARPSSAHGACRLLRVGRAARARPVAALGRVAGPRRRPAHRAGVARRVLTRIARAVAGVGRARIAVVDARRPARLLGVGGTTRTRARAGLRQVALARRRATHGAGGLEGIGRTGRARAVAALGRVAGPRRRAAHRAGMAGRVLARVARAVAGVGRARIAVVGARRPARLFGVGGTTRTRARTGLRKVALAHGRAAHGVSGLESIGRTRRARPVAALGHVADAGRRAAHAARRLLGVSRAARARAVAALGHVAGPRRRAAHRAGMAGRVLARVARAVAGVGRARIAVVGARRPARLFGVRRTRGTRARTGLRQVARAHGRAAHGAGGLESIGRTRRARPVARLGHVADADRRAAHAARRLLGVSRAARARAVAVLGHVAGPRRRAAHRAGMAGRVLARVARAVAGVGRARTAVVGARRPARRLRVGGTTRTRARAGLRPVALA